MVSRRAGKAKLGCLLTMIIIAVIGYFGVHVGKAYWGYYQFQDRMKQEARFAMHRSDALITKRLKEFADSLDLPEGAHNVNVRRRQRTIQIWAEYYQIIEFPGFVREVYFHPQAVGTF
jgi:hypothetical protein